MFLTPVIGWAQGGVVEEVESSFAGWEHPVQALGWSTLAYVAAIFVIIWGRRWLLRALAKLAASKSKHIESLRLRRLGLQQIVVLMRTMLQLASVVLLLLVTLLWLGLLMMSLELTREVGLLVVQQVEAGARQLGVNLLQALPGLLAVVLVFGLARFLHRLINQFFELVVEGGLASEMFDPATAEMTRRLAQVGLWLSAVIIAYPYIPGSSSPAFRGVSVLAGLMLSLGSTNLVSQLTNGLILTYTRAIRTGDYVRAGNHEGTVMRLGFFTTTLRTAREEVIALPNSQLAAGVTNYSCPQDGAAVRFSISVGIGYDTPWQQVHELLLAAAATVEGVQAEPAPEVRQSALNDFTVQYELRFSPVEPARRAALTSALHVAVQDRFARAGVQIMSPHYVADPSTPKIPPSAGGGSTSG